MSVCGQSGQAEEDSATEEGGPTAPSATRDIYKQKPASKVVRVLTVLAYLLSVSLAAILLSVYYICVWRSPEMLRGAANHTQQEQYQRQHQPPQHNHTQHEYYQRQQQPLQSNHTQHKLYQRHHHPLQVKPSSHVEQAATPEANPFGGGNTTVNGDVVHSAPENITGAFNEDSVTETTSGATPNATALLDADTTSGLNGSLQFNNETDSVT